MEQVSLTQDYKEIYIAALKQDSKIVEIGNALRYISKPKEDESLG